MIDLHTRVETGELTLQALSADQKDKLARRETLEKSVSEEEAALEAIKSKHLSAYEGAEKLTDSESQELATLNRNIETGEDTTSSESIKKVQEGEPSVPTTTGSSITSALQAEIDKDIAAKRDELSAQLRPSVANVAAKSDNIDSVSEKLLHTAKLSSTPISPTTPAPAPSLYIPVHLRASSAATARSILPPTEQKSPNTASAALASRSVWGRAAPLPFSAPLSAFKDSVPVSAPTRESNQASELSSVASSTSGTPTNYFSAQSSPANKTMTAAAKEFVPTFARPAAPILQTPPSPQSLSTNMPVSSVQSVAAEAGSSLASPKPATFSWAQRVSATKK